MHDKILEDPFYQTDTINPGNIDVWFKMFKTYANVCEKFFAEEKTDKCISIGADAVKIYSNIVEYLKNTKTLKGEDLKTALSRFREEDKFSNQEYKELCLIKKVSNSMGKSYRILAEEAYKSQDYIQALKLSKNAVLYAPDDVFTNFTLAKTLSNLHANKESADSYETVVKLDKNYNEGRRILGDLYSSSDLQNPDKAIENYRAYFAKVKQKYETDITSLINLADQCYKIGLQAECKKICEGVLKKYPDNFRAIILYHLNLVKIDGFSQESINNITKNIVEKYIKASKIKKHSFSFAKRKKNPDKKLRIGYLSSDFCSHVVSKFFLPYVENYNKEDFEIYLYYLRKEKDRITQKYEKYADKFTECCNMTEDEIAKTVYDDKVDILVDLNGYTGYSKTMVLARKPAPIQCIYLGYPNTSGLDTVDYILTDKDTIHPDEAEFYTETPAYIEAGYEIVKPDFTAIPDVKPAPYIKNKYVTMGVFNSTSKVTNEMLVVWADILKKSKNTKIIFQYFNHYTKNTQKRILETFKNCGIKEDRILFPEKDKEIYFNNFSEADFALDTFPYSGTSTTVDCLLMGLPIVCVQGFNTTSRPTSRILKAIGETRLVGNDFKDYVNIALKLISEPDLITYYRKCLRDKFVSSKLFDYKAFSSSIEETYTKMWQDYCNK